MKLFNAARSGDIQGIKDAIEAGADPNHHDGWTSLNWVLREGNVECTRTLLELGADPNFVADEKNKNPPLFWASIAYKNKAQVLRELFKFGAKIDPQNNEAALMVFRSVAENLSQWMLEESDKEALLVLMEYLRPSESLIRCIHLPNIPGSAPRAEQAAILKCPFGRWKPIQEVHRNVPESIREQMKLLLLANRCKDGNFISWLPRDVLFLIFGWIVSFPMPKNCQYASRKDLEFEQNELRRARERIEMNEHSRLHEGSLIEFSSADDSMEGDRMRCCCLQFESRALPCFLACLVLLFPICLPLSMICGCMYCRTRGICVCCCVERQMNAHLRHYK